MIILTAMVVVGRMEICTGCSKENTEIDNSEVEEQTISTSSEYDELKINFTYDYSEDIKADVDDVVSNSTSLQEELTNIEKIIHKYAPLVEAADEG